MLDEQSGCLRPAGNVKDVPGRDGVVYGLGMGRDWDPSRFYHDHGGASRFFYTAKAKPGEREAGLAGFREVPANHHPTVKPIALMRWLVRLISEPDALVIDPFMGSGTTGIACALEGRRFIGIEREPEYAAIAEARIAHWSAQQRLPLELL